MRRVAASLILGGLAGALSVFSHAAAGGAVHPGPVLLIVAGSAVAFAAAPARMRGLGGTVGLLIAVQMGAHLWLETVNSHHGTQSHGHGVAGAIEHALSPGMLMMWTHLAAVIVGAVFITVVRPLLETMLARAAIGLIAWPVPAEAPRCIRSLSQTSAHAMRSFLLAHSIEGRGPPVFT